MHVSGELTNRISDTRYVFVADHNGDRYLVTDSADYKLTVRGTLIVTPGSRSFLPEVKEEAANRS